MSSLTQCFASGLKHTSNNVIGLIGKSKQVNKVIPVIQEFWPSIKVQAWSRCWDWRRPLPHQSLRLVRF